VTVDVEYDVLGFGFGEIALDDHQAVRAAYPRIDFEEPSSRRSAATTTKRERSRVAIRPSRTVFDTAGA
jgi:hypothetical protein